MPSASRSGAYGAVGGATPGQPSQLSSPGSRPACEYEEDSDDGAGAKTSFHLPSSKTTRKMAGKAGKVATKGATKVATAFKKGLKRAQAAGEAAAKDSSMAAGDDSAGLIQVQEGECPEGEADESEGSSRGAHSQSQAQGQSQAQAVKVKPCRALQLESIWDIPTARFPEPVPEPAVAPEELEAQVIGARKVGNLKLPKITVAAKSPGKRPKKASPAPCLSRRLKLGLALFITLVAAGGAAFFFS